MAKKKKPEAVTSPATVSEAAQRLGVGERTLAAWLSKGCPGKPGAYDLDAIRVWRAANVKPRGGHAENPGRAKWEEKKARAEALMKELRYREARGQLISVARAAQVVKQHVAEAASHLDQLPDFAAAGLRLPAEQKRRLRERLRKKIADLRTTLERSLRSLAKAAAQEGKHQPTDEENSEAKQREAAE